MLDIKNSQLPSHCTRSCLLEAMRAALDTAARILTPSNLFHPRQNGRRQSELNLKTRPETYEVGVTIPRVDSCNDQSRSLARLAEDARVSRPLPLARKPRRVEEKSRGNVLLVVDLRTAVRGWRVKVRASTLGEEGICGETISLHAGMSMMNEKPLKRKRNRWTI